MEELNIKSLFIKKFLKGNSHMGHKFVDLALPSGNLWATCNIGATKSYSHGLFLQWGDVKGYKPSDLNCGKEIFNWQTYKFSGKGQNQAKMTKYTEYDMIYILEPQDDAAHVIWGGLWQIPTSQDAEELMNHTHQESSKHGIYFISNYNNKYIFMPYSGYCLFDEHYHFNSGSIWLKNLTFDNGHTMACRFFYTLNELNVGRCFRDYGLTIRPIIKCQN